MNRRHLVYGSVIAALLAINLLRWGVSARDGREQEAARAQGFAPRDFQLRANFPVAAEPRRNLFVPQAAGPAVPTPRADRPPRREIPAAAAPVAPPAEAPAVAALGRLRLLGVVFRAGQGQAYLALDKDNVMAQRGDTVFGQFTVERVAVEAVELRHIQTNTIRKIPVSGR